MPRITTLLLLLPVQACGAETGFGTTSKSNGTNDDVGAMTVYPDVLTWTDLTVGDALGEPFKITSSGAQTLHVYEVSIVSSADGQFAMTEPDAFDLDPGQSQEFRVLCTLAADAPANGELRIRSNDAAQLDFRLALQASPAGTDTASDTGTDTGTDTDTSG